VFNDPVFEMFGKRAALQAGVGGAEPGECAATAARIADGDRDSWHAEWSATADRLSDAAAASAAAGHPVSAREGYLTLIPE